MKPATVQQMATPLKIGEYDNDLGQQAYRIINADGKLVAQSRGAGGPKTQSKANAALIVRAVNAYEKDQETIRELLASLREYKEAAVNGSVVTIGMARRSAAAIAKAESHEKPL